MSNELPKNSSNALTTVLAKLCAESLCTYVTYEHHVRNIPGGIFTVLHEALRHIPSLGDDLEIESKQVDAWLSHKNGSQTIGPSTHITLAQLHESFTDLRRQFPAQELATALINMLNVINLTQKPPLETALLSLCGLKIKTSPSGFPTNERRYTDRTVSYPEYVRALIFLLLAEEEPDHMVGTALLDVLYRSLYGSRDGCNEPTMRIGACDFPFNQLVPGYQSPFYSGGVYPAFPLIPELE